MGREQLARPLGLEACDGAEGGRPRELGQRRVPGHREQTLLRVLGPPDPGQGGGIGAKLEIRVRQHLCQTPGMLVWLEVS